VLAIGILLLGALTAFLMHPERQFTEDAPSGAQPAAAE
jgi:hypothetical protein